MLLVELAKGVSINPEKVITVRREKLKLPLAPGQKSKCTTRDEDHPKDTEKMCPICDADRYRDGVIIYTEKSGQFSWLISEYSYEETKRLLQRKK